TANSDSKGYGTLKAFSTTAFTVTGLVSGDTVTGVTETSAGAPVAAPVGGYDIVASAATGTGVANYRIHYVSGELTVTPATPVVSVSAAGGLYRGSPLPAAAQVQGVGGPPADTLEGVRPTLAYYAGSSATGPALAQPPSAAGTYTVVASFAGSADYTAATGAAGHFTIGLNPPALRVFTP